MRGERLSRNVRQFGEFGVGSLRNRRKEPWNRLGIGPAVPIGNGGKQNRVAKPGADIEA